VIGLCPFWQHSSIYSLFIAVIDCLVWINIVSLCLRQMKISLAELVWWVWETFPVPPFCKQTQIPCLQAKYAISGLVKKQLMVSQSFCSGWLNITNLGHLRQLQFFLAYFRRRQKFNVSRYLVAARKSASGGPS